MHFFSQVIIYFSWINCAVDAAAAQKKEPVVINCDEIPALFALTPNPATKSGVVGMGGAGEGGRRGLPSVEGKHSDGVPRGHRGDMQKQSLGALPPHNPRFRRQILNQCEQRSRMHS